MVMAMTTPRPLHRARLVAAAALCSTALLAAACGESSDSGQSSTSGDDTTPAVVASTSIWADVTSQVGCEQVDVTTLIPVGTDAHAYEPSVQDADLLSGAGLIVANGLGLEEGAIDAIETAEADGVPVVEVGEELDPIEGSHSHSEDEAAHSEDEAGHSEDEAGHSEDEAGHDHGDGKDPHVWMDPDRVALAVPLIAEGLKGVEGLPVDAAQIDECAQAYVEELTALSAELDEQFAGLDESQRQLVTNHEALGYLADRFGFEVVGTVIPSTSSLGESNARDLEELVSTMQERGVTRIYGEVTGSDEVSAALAEQIGGDVEIVALYTESLGEQGSGAETYVDMMRTNGTLISQQ
jgi:zinc/manganese transport system substrate-binding protein